ncbi:hypothetical protein E4U34_003771 [Claviceps purpurea]|nr:hypothetical protein E4U34_003771 [Claviceps purpurea]
MVVLPCQADSDAAELSPPSIPERKKRWAAKVKTGCATCRHSSKEEEYMFHLLCTEATVKISGGFDLSFWTIDVPRATRAYPAIWHASASLAAMYKCIQHQDRLVEKDKLYKFSLAQYNKSIRNILSINPNLAELSYYAQETLLFASVLFTSICILQGDQEKAKVHVDRGIELFNHFRFWEHLTKLPNPDDVSTVHSLVALFTRFELESSFSVPPKPFWQTISFDKRQAPAVFTSATDAYYEQQQLLNNLIKVYRTEVAQHLKGNTSHPSQKRLAYRYQYRRWKNRFEKLKNMDHRAKLILQMYALAIEIILYVDSAAAELGWDRYTYTFRRILTLSKELFALETAPNADKNGATTLFSFSPVSCHPCLGIGVLCRDGPLRRKSIELLKQWPLRDGMVNYKIAASILEAIMIYEESHTKKKLPCSECESTPATRICGPHRVLYRDMEPNGEGKGKLRMTTVDDVRHGRCGKVVDIAWG